MIKGVQELLYHHNFTDVPQFIKWLTSQIEGTPITCMKSRAMKLATAVCIKDRLGWLKWTTTVLYPEFGDESENGKLLFMVSSLHNIMHGEVPNEIKLCVFYSAARQVYTEYLESINDVTDD